MKIKIENNKLLIKPGMLHSEISIEITSVDSWSLVIDDLGTPYLYFNYSGLVQGLALPKSDSDELKGNIELLKTVLKMEPEIEISRYQSLFDNSFLSVTGIELFFLALVSINS